MIDYSYTGTKVVNTNSGVTGVILRIFENGSIQVIEKITPYVICTHDSWKTLKIIE